MKTIRLNPFQEQLLREILAEEIERTKSFDPTIFQNKSQLLSSLRSIEKRVNSK